MRLMGSPLCWTYIAFGVLTDLSLTLACGTVMFTDKTVYTIGETIHINCSVPSSSTPPDPSEFSIVRCPHRNKDSTTHNENGISNYVVPTEFRVSQNTGFTETEVRSILDEGTYICYYGDCREVLMTSFEKIYVSRNVSNYRRPDMSCVSDSYWNMTCRWGSRDTEVVTTYRVSYTIEGNATVYCCGDGQATCAATMTRYCVIPTEQFHRGLLYNIYLEVISRINTTQMYNYTIRTDNSIVKLHIDDLRMSTPSIRQLLWTLTSDLAPQSVGGVMCNVTVLSQWEADTSFNVSVTSTSRCLQVTGTLSNLYPYTQYTVKLQCRPSASSHWSNVITAIGTTLPEPPAVSPKVFGYSENERRILIYVQSLAKKLYYDKEAFYTVEVHINNNTLRRTYDAASSTLDLNMTLHQNLTYTFVLTTMNGVGKSSNATQYAIPVNDNLTTPDVVVDQETSHVFDVLLFGSRHDATRVCYYSCRVKDKPVPPMCLGHLEIHCVDRVQDIFTLHLNYSTDNTQTAVGVAFVTHATQISHIHWSDCSFQNQENYKNTKLPVTVTKIYDTTMQVTLNFRYCQLPRRPLVYQIATQVESNSTCSFTESINITASPSVTQIQTEVEDMDSIKSVCFRALYKHEDANQAYDITVNAYKASVQYKSSNKQTVIVVAAGLAFVLMILLAFGLKRYRQKLRSKELVQDLLSDLLPPGGSPLETTANMSRQESFKKIDTISTSSPLHYATIDVVARGTGEESRSTPISSYESPSDLQVRSHCTAGHNDFKSDDGSRVNEEHAESSEPRIANSFDNMGLASEDITYSQIKGTNTNEIIPITVRNIDTNVPKLIKLNVDEFFREKNDSDSRKHSMEPKDIKKLLYNVRTLSNGEQIDNVDLNNTPNGTNRVRCDTNDSMTNEVDSGPYVDSYTRVTLPIDSGECVSNYVTMAQMT